MYALSQHHIDVLDAHERIVLQFSGGKDSLAVLRLLKNYLHKTTVLWMNAGAALPETLLQMAAVRAECPTFLEVHSDVEAGIAADGFPVDLLPIRSHRSLTGCVPSGGLRMQSFIECCQNNLMLPMHRATLALGATLLIRGQKSADGHKGPFVSGDVVDGMELMYPLEGWCDADVLAYLRGDPLLPAHYSEGGTSLDCWGCTAYLGENQWKLGYLTRNHPEKGAEVRRRIIAIAAATRADVRNLEMLL